MGFAIPAAMAAKLAAPRRKVVALLGDAGFAMAGLELLTAVREKIPLTAIVFADGFDGLIRLKQLQEYGRAFGTDLANPDFGALAGSLGIGYALAKGNPEPALAAAIASNGVTLVEVRLSIPTIGPRAREGAATGAAESVLGEEMLATIRRTIRKLR